MFFSSIVSGFGKVELLPKSGIIATFFESVSLFFLSSGTFYFLGNNSTFWAIIPLFSFPQLY
tara:strand:+ start:239 stop:424 length:186 start_codon:yes stop_codon:yes gene_type:complete